MLLRGGRACSEVCGLREQGAETTLGDSDQPFDPDGSIPGSCRVCPEVPQQIVEGWKSGSAAMQGALLAPLGYLV